MKKIVLKTMAVAMVVALVSCGPKKTDDKKEAEKQNEGKFDNSAIEDDAKFAVAAADGGLLEVELGRLAQTNGLSGEVKSFGQMMVDDHSKGNSELNALATRKNITLPADLSNTNRDAYEDLAKKKGKEFDKAYTAFMVKDHKEDIEEFKQEADKGKDPDLKEWASGKVSVLEHHLEAARQAEAAVDKMK